MATEEGPGRTCHCEDFDFCPGWDGEPGRLVRTPLAMVWRTDCRGQGAWTERDQPGGYSSDLGDR